MKMTTLIGFCSLMVLGISANSQKISYKFSDGSNTRDKNYSQSVETRQGRLVLKDEAQTYGGLVQIYVNKKASILLLNDKMETVKEMPITFKNSMFVNLKGLYQLDGKTILVYSYKNDKKDIENIISAIKLNESDNSFGEEVELARFNGPSGREMPDFRLNLSADSSLYFLFIEPSQKKKEMKQFYYGVFNNNLKKQFDKTIELPAENQDVAFTSILLDKHANLFLEYNKTEDSKKGVYTTKLSQYSDEGKIQNDIDLSLDGNMLNRTNFLFDRGSENIIIAGTYRNAKDLIQGVFYSEYNPITKKSSNSRLSEIPEDILELFEKEDIASNSKKSKGLEKYFEAKDFKRRANGTYDYTLEYNRRYARTSVGSNAKGAVVFGPDYYSYTNGSILNINLNGKGKSIFTRIPKSQNDVYSSFISHFSFYNGNNLIFLYNDDKDNVDRDLNKTPDAIDLDKHAKKSVLMAAIIDEKGNLQRQIVYEHDDDKFISMIDKFKMLSSNTLYIMKEKTSIFTTTLQKFGVLTIN